MGEVEHILFKALHTLGLKAPPASLLPGALEQMSRNAENMSIKVESITTERGFGEPTRITIELTDWSECFRPGWTRGARQPRRDYDYESTAEEIVELPEQRKELPSG